MKQLSTFFIALIVNLLTGFCHSQQDNRCEFYILTYGLPSGDFITSRKWDLGYWPVAGCMVSDELMDSVKRHNDSIMPLIEQKYGKGWEERYWKEVADECEIQHNVMQLLDELDYIQNKRAELRAEGNGLHYSMNPQTNNCYYVTAEGWGTLNDEWEWVIYYTFYVRLNSKEVMLLDDKIRAEK